MPTFVRSIVLGDNGKTHRPTEGEEKLNPSDIPIATDSDNALTVKSSGLYVKESTGGSSGGEERKPIYAWAEKGLGFNFANNSGNNGQGLGGLGGASATFIDWVTAEDEADGLGWDKSTGVLTFTEGGVYVISFSAVISTSGCTVDKSDQLFTYYGGYLPSAVNISDSGAADQYTRVSQSTISYKYSKPDDLLYGSAFSGSIVRRMFADDSIKFLMSMSMGPVNGSPTMIIGGKARFSVVRV